MELPYSVIKPKGQTVPIVVSVPHVGTSFPADIEDLYKEQLIYPPDDTDFLVHQLYDFVSEMGITLVYANYSRWVIDLNRSPHNEALYKDGRIITDLTPTSNFLGEAIYKQPAFCPNQAEVDRRINQYYQPYYDQLASLLADLKSQFGIALLWDAHSIRRSVPTIQAPPFPDLIMGTNEGASAHDSIIQTALTTLQASPYQVTYNHPFKGGNITRHFGKPSEDIHAIQLEMCKDLYLADDEVTYHPVRAERVKNILQPMFRKLIANLT